MKEELLFPTMWALLYSMLEKTQEGDSPNIETHWAAVI